MVWEGKPLRATRGPSTCFHFRFQESNGSGKRTLALSQQMTRLTTKFCRSPIPGGRADQRNTACRRRPRSGEQIEAQASPNTMAQRHVRSTENNRPSREGRLLAGPALPMIRKNHRRIREFGTLAAQFERRWMEQIMSYGTDLTAVPIPGWKFPFL